MLLYIWCCCCCGRSGGGAAYFAGGWRRRRWCAPGAGGRGGWPPAVRQAVRRVAASAAQVRLICRRVARRLVRGGAVGDRFALAFLSWVINALPNVLQPSRWLGAARPQRVRFFGQANKQRSAGRHQSTKGAARPLAIKRCWSATLACVDTPGCSFSLAKAKARLACSKIAHKRQEHYRPARPALLRWRARRATTCLA